MPTMVVCLTPTKALEEGKLYLPTLQIDSGSCLQRSRVFNLQGSIMIYYTHIILNHILIKYKYTSN